jgi:hypothetical protein
MGNICVLNLLQRDQATSRLILRQTHAIFKSNLRIGPGSFLTSGRLNAGVRKVAEVNSLDATRSLITLRFAKGGMKLRQQGEQEYR